VQIPYGTRTANTQPAAPYHTLYFEYLLTALSALSTGHYWYYKGGRLQLQVCLGCAGRRTPSKCVLYDCSLETRKIERICQRLTEWDNKDLVALLTICVTRAMKVSDTAILIEGQGIEVVVYPTDAMATSKTDLGPADSEYKLINTVYHVPWLLFQTMLSLSCSC
jgi:hypothetical protein